MNIRAEGSKLDYLPHSVFLNMLDGADDLK